MDSPNIAYERISGPGNVVRIPLGEATDTDYISTVLRNTFEERFKAGDARFVVDLKGLELLPSSLIALLIEMTSRARRLDGDVKIINLSSTVKGHIGSFSPRSYLALEDSETEAIRKFAPAPRERTASAESPRAPEEKVLHVRSEGERRPLPAVDIAEDPIVEKLQTERSVEATASAPAGRTTAKTTVSPQKSGGRNHLRVESSTKNLYSICDFVIEHAAKAGLDDRVNSKMRIAIYEACLNVVEHAYHSKPDNWIDVWIEYNTEMFKVVIQDYGDGFDGFSDAKYDVVSAMDGRQTGGFGLYIILRSMDEVDYRPDARHGNRLTMVKFIPQE